MTELAIRYTSIFEINNLIFKYYDNLESYYIFERIDTLIINLPYFENRRSINFSKKKFPSLKLVFFEKLNPTISKIYINDLDLIIQINDSKYFELINKIISDRPIKILFYLNSNTSIVVSLPLITCIAQIESLEIKNLAKNKIQIEFQSLNICSVIKNFIYDSATIELKIN